MKFEPFFKLIARKGVRGVVTDSGKLLFAHLTPAQARKEWEAGATFLVLTPEGAKEFYASTPPDQRIALLNHCKTIAEVEALNKLPRNTQAFKTAAQQRIAQWATPAASSGEAGGTQPKG